MTAPNTQDMRRLRHKLALWLLGNPDEERVLSVYVHTALSGELIYDAETGKLCPATNDHHAMEAKRIASKLYDEHQEREIAEMMRGDDE